MYTPPVSQRASQIPVMSPTHKYVLAQMGPILTENLQIEGILPVMLENGIITNQNAENIMNKTKTEQGQVFEFLQILPKCGPRAFGNFVRALRMQNITELADALDKKATELSSNNQLANIYIRCLSQIQRFPWDTNDTMHIDEVYVNLKWVKEDKLPTGASQIPAQDYSSIFKDNKEGKQPKRILIRGKAGIGKTTCTQKMAVDWANGKLSAFTHLLVLNLRHVKPKQTLKDAINMQLTLSREFQHDVTDEIMNSVYHDSSNVLLILDGYDEYDIETSEEITDTINNKMHQNVCTVITTRPWKAEDLMSQRIIDSFYEITGLTEENVTQYVANFFDDKELYKQYRELEIQGEQKKACECRKAIGHGLEGYIHQRNLQSLASIPILLLFICLLWQEERQSGEGTNTLPASNTMLYETLIELLIRRRYSAKTKTDMDSYTDKLQQTFINIGKRALVGLLKPEGGLVFDDDDLHSIKHLQELYNIGILSTSKFHCGTEVKHATTFLHKTIQEFFAAKYLAHNIEKDGSILEDFLNRLEAQEKLLDFQYVLLFACGLSERGTSGILKKATHIAATENYDAGVDFFVSDIEPKLVKECKLFNDLIFEHWNACSYENKTLPPELQHWRRVLIIPESLEHSDPTFQHFLQDSALSDPRSCDFQGVKVICCTSGAFTRERSESKYVLTKQLLLSLSKCEMFTELTTFVIGNPSHWYGLFVGHVVSKSPKLHTLDGSWKDIINIPSIQNPANMRHLNIAVRADIDEQDMAKLRKMELLEYLHLFGKHTDHPSEHLHSTCTCTSLLGELPQISHRLTGILFENMPLGAAGVKLLGENLHYVSHLTCLKLDHVFSDRCDDRCRSKCICSEGSDQNDQCDKCEHVRNALSELSKGLKKTTELENFSFSNNCIGRYHGISSPLISLIESLSKVSQQTDMRIGMNYNELGRVDHLSELMKAIVSSYKHVVSWGLAVNNFCEHITMLTRGLDKLHSVKLRKIDITCNKDEDAKERVKSEFLQHMPKLKLL